MLLAYAQMRKLRTLRTGDLTEPLQLSREQERELFRRLARGGLIARVRPGLFLVPPRLPLGGAWTPNEAEALNALMQDAGGRYQICGANAFNRYGFDDQIPIRVYAYNNRISGDRKIGAVDVTLIKVADKRLGDTMEARWRTVRRRCTRRGFGRWWMQCTTGRGLTAFLAVTSGYARS